MIPVLSCLTWYVRFNWHVHHAGEWRYLCHWTGACNIENLVGVSQSAGNKFHVHLWLQWIVCHGTHIWVILLETDLVPFSVTTQVFICVQLCIYLYEVSVILNFYKKCICCVVFLSLLLFFFLMCVCSPFVSPHMKTNYLTSSMWQSPCWEVNSYTGS